MKIRWRPIVRIGLLDALYTDCALPGESGEHVAYADRERAIAARAYLLGRAVGRADARHELSSELARIDELQRRAERTMAELFELARTELEARGRPTNVQPR